MKKLIFFVFLICSSAFAEDLILFHNTQIKISYDEKSQSYVFNDKKKNVSFPRHAYKEVIDLVIPYLTGSDYKKVKDVITTHSLSLRLANPTPEEELQQAFKTQTLALSLLETNNSPCPNATKMLTGPSQYKIEFNETDKNNDIDHKIVKTELAKKGFFLMGDILGVGYELNSSNDNFLHGGGIAMGVTKFNHGIDGDDRGKTFGLVNKINLEFEKGNISLKNTTQGFGRVKPQRKTIYTYNGTPIEQLVSYDEDGKYYQEFLTIDGLELEVKRELGSSDFYVKVIGKREVFDDNKGLAKKIQEGWHSMDKRNVQYNYVDYKEKTIRYSGFTELGRNFTLNETDKYRVSSDLAAGAQFSNEREGQYVSARGDLKLEWKGTNDEGKKFASWEGRVYWDGKVYRDKEKDRNFGIEVTKRWSVSKNGFIYLQAAVAQEDERYAREYGAKEFSNKGHLDIQHKLGIGFEYKF